jgi:hypothetical protein
VHIIKYRIALIGCVAMLGGLTACVPTNAGRATGQTVGVSDHADQPPPVAATPELGSLMLFGAGVAGAAGYVSQRARAARRL